MQMERLCEDELMCIQQYAPMAEIGVSDERLYNEIRLLDPSFSMTRLCEQLLQWRRDMFNMKADRKSYLLYEVLSRYHIYKISTEPRRRGCVECWFTVDGSSIDGMRNGLSLLGYTVHVHRRGLTVSSGCQSDIIIKVKADVHDKLVSIEHVAVSHPIRNMQYRGSRSTSRTNTYGYNPWSGRHPETYADNDNGTYDYRAHNEILSIDPTISMNLLYGVYMNKHARERAVRNAYKLWCPYLDMIESVTMNMYGSVSLNIRKDVKGDLERMSELESVRNICRWRYDRKDTYDKILTMLRMYYSYNSPVVGIMGTIYYDP